MNDKEKLQYILTELKEILAEDPLFNNPYQSEIVGKLKERLEDMQWVIEEVKGSDDYIPAKEAV